MITKFIIATALTATFLTSIPAHAGVSYEPFGSFETQVTGTKGFKKWNSVIDRYKNEQNDPVYVTLDAFLNTLRSKSRHEQIVAVNAYMNARPYTADIKNWGQREYWASPAEFMARSGDCEDFAIAKFFALKRLGWDASALRIAAVKDLNHGVGHAITIAFDDGKSWILDNQIKHVVAANSVTHYKPVYSINEYAWWRPLK